MVRERKWYGGGVYKSRSHCCQAHRLPYTISLTSIIGHCISPNHVGSSVIQPCVVPFWCRVVWCRCICFCICICICVCINNIYEGGGEGSKEVGKEGGEKEWTGGVGRGSGGWGNKKREEIQARRCESMQV